jgi:hypothetical protein
LTSDMHLRSMALSLLARLYSDTEPEQSASMIIEGMKICHRKILKGQYVSLAAQHSQLDASLRSAGVDEEEIDRIKGLVERERTSSWIRISKYLDLKGN